VNLLVLARSFLLMSAIACAFGADEPLKTPPKTTNSTGLGPQPVAQPMMPDADDDATLSPEARLDRRLNELVRACDHKINAIIKDRGGERPTGEPIALASHEQQRKERDQAWQDFHKTMQAYLAKSRSHRLDTATITDPKAKAEQNAALNASNQLAIAECYKELIASSKAKPEDFAAGMKALDIDPKQLPPIEQPRHGYLRVWYVAEQARRSTGEDRAKFVKAAQQAQLDLNNQFPHNSLAQTAQALLLDLDLAPGAEKSK
jgi:hypothetical protein